MKTFLILFFAAITISAQTIYKVIPGSRDNKIYLTVENFSSIVEMTDVKVQLSHFPEALNFMRGEQLIEKIGSQDSANVVFPFDVLWETDLNKTDTLLFVINGKSGRWTKEILIGYELPKEYNLDQNYPNPFNPSTVISYQLPAAGRVVLKVYNVLGSEVATLVNDFQPAGKHLVTFYSQQSSDNYRLASGIYIYRLQAGNFTSVKKMILMK